MMLRDELRDRVASMRADHDWIDIISKVDQQVPEIAMIQERCVESATCGTTQLTCPTFNRLEPSCYLVSAQSNQGLVELGEGIRRVLVQPHEEQTSSP